MKTSKRKRPTITQNAAAYKRRNAGEANRTSRIGNAGISGASAGALVGTAIGGLAGGVVGAALMGVANMLLNSYNERSANL